MGAQPSSISRDSLYPDEHRQPQNIGRDSGKRRADDRAQEHSERLASTSGNGRSQTFDEDRQSRRLESVSASPYTQEMQSLSEELNRRPPTWEYRIDEYGKVAKRSRTPTLQKLKEEPLVPLGIFGTVAVLFMASREFQRGDSRQMNRYLWWRVYAQGATIAAMVGGSIYYETTRAKRVEAEARSRGWPVEEARIAAGWRPDGEERLSGRRPPSFWDPFRRLASALSR